MAPQANETPCFPGFPDFQANVTFVPIQFFTVVVPHCSRGTVRIVGYALRKVLGWVDEHGNPTQEQLRFTYRELIDKAGVSRESIAEALREATERHLLRCVQRPLPDRNGQPGQSGIYELCWDQDGRYTDCPAEFRGFYYPEAAVIQVREGAGVVARPKAARKNIPNAFFDYLLPRERLSVIRVVSALLFYSIQWGPGGERKLPVRRSITELSRLTKLSRQHVHEAVMQAQERGYIHQVEAGYFDPAAGKESRAATYGIRWVMPMREGQAPTPPADDTTSQPVRKSERELERWEKVNGAPIRKDERNQSERVNGERSKMVNDIRIKKELKKEQTTARTEGSASADVSKLVAAAAAGVELLRNAGFDEVTANRLAHKRSEEVIERQIGWLPKRAPARNRLGLLRRAIEQDWLEPEGIDTSEDSLTPQAKEFASHYYAAYHDFPGKAGTESFPKDISVSVKFVSRLLAQESDKTKMPEWGRRFGHFMRERHQGDAKAKPNLSFALVLYGDKFLRLLQNEATARHANALGQAREAHQKAFLDEYISYLRQAHEKLQQSNPSIYKPFVEHRTRLRRLMASGPFLSSAERLSRFDSDESRLLDFGEFFHEHPDQFVLSFWRWDDLINPRRFGGNPKPVILKEANT